MKEAEKSQEGRESSAYLLTAGSRDCWTEQASPGITPPLLPIASARRATFEDCARR